LNDALLLSATATFCYVVSALAVIYANNKFSSGIFKSSLNILTAALVLLLYVALLNLLELFYTEVNAILLPMRLGVLLATSILFVLFGRKLLEMSDLFGLAKPKPLESPEKEHDMQT
jgi:hypothetical protein